MVLKQRDPFFSELKSILIQALKRYQDKIKLSEREKIYSSLFTNLLSEINSNGVSSEKLFTYLEGSNSRPIKEAIIRHAILFNSVTLLENKRVFSEDFWNSSLDDVTGKNQYDQALKWVFSYQAYHVLNSILLFDTNFWDKKLVKNGVELTRRDKLLGHVIFRKNYFLLKSQKLFPLDFWDKFYPGSKQKLTNKDQLFYQVFIKKQFIETLEKERLESPDFFTNEWSDVLSILNSHCPPTLTKQTIRRYLFEVAITNKDFAFLLESKDYFPNSFLDNKFCDDEPETISNTPILGLILDFFLSQKRYYFQNEDDLIIEKNTCSNIIPSLSNLSNRDIILLKFISEKSYEILDNKEILPMSYWDKVSYKKNISNRGMLFDLLLMGSNFDLFEQDIFDKSFWSRDYSENLPIKLSNREALFFILEERTKKENIRFKSIALNRIIFPNAFLNKILLHSGYSFRDILVEIILASPLNREVLGNKYLYGENREEASSYIKQYAPNIIPPDVIHPRVENRKKILKHIAEEIKRVIPSIFESAKNKFSSHLLVLLRQSYPKKKQSILYSLMMKKFKEYKCTSLVECLELSYDKVLVIQQENTGYYSLKEFLACLHNPSGAYKGQSPLTRLIVFSEDISVGFLEEDLKNIIAKEAEDYEKQCSQQAKGLKSYVPLLSFLSKDKSQNVLEKAIDAGKSPALK